MPRGLLSFESWRHWVNPFFFLSRWNYSQAGHKCIKSSWTIEYMKAYAIFEGLSSITELHIIQPQWTRTHSSKSPWMKCRSWFLNLNMFQGFDISFRFSLSLDFVTRTPIALFIGRLHWTSMNVRTMMLLLICYLF